MFSVKAAEKKPKPYTPFRKYVRKKLKGNRCYNCRHNHRKECSSQNCRCPRCHGDRR